jgi:hypothetical protein
MTSSDTSSILADAIHLVDVANRDDVPLRLIGGAAAEYHNHSKIPGLTEPEKSRLKDVDMVTYRLNRVEVNKNFSDEGYVSDRYVMAYFGEERFLFRHPADKFKVDIFFENLRFNHLINLRPEQAQPRIELDYPTLTIADLILSKLQIHSIEEKDLRDLQILILEHPLVDSDIHESINITRIASVLADDWGFNYDAKLNLSKILISDNIDNNSVEDLKDKVAKIITRIDSEPKSRKWEKRRLQGTAKRWWNEVEELVR